MFTCLIDTNVLVACRDLEDLDGFDSAPITREDEIHIIVPDTVNREIDKLKENGRSRPGEPL
jgi:rRNA-processing protein FCF1